MTKTLDLHGVKHEDVDRLVENFVLLNEPPLSIITGNSDKMNKLVRAVFDRNNSIEWTRWGFGEWKIL